MKTGDILVAINGKTIEDSNAMLDTVANMAPGKIALLKLIRNGTAIDLKVKIGRRPIPKEESE
jgi:S1-C subfamily serine protease